ncbi:MAG: hypothetical protein IPJ31_12745 [Bacteroidetes bacterium]|nr:hypothetical protein [Bacteroidota bacterium]
MTIHYKILTVLLFAFVLDCNAQADIKTPLIAKDLTNEKERNNTLIAFVGEKLELNDLPHEKNQMDRGFKAKYKVLQMVYGIYLGDTIEFTVYDHYGIPYFSEFKNVLLFVSEYKGQYYHQKYEFYDVYRTKNNRWASPHKEGHYYHPNNVRTSVKPEKIIFEEKPIKQLISDGFPIDGNYVEELFRLSKDGVLTSCGLFGN